MEDTNLKKFLKGFATIIKMVLIIVLINITMRTFLFGAYNVDSGSMETTLMTNDKVGASLLNQYTKKYERGDIIVFTFPETDFEKGTQKLRMNPILKNIAIFSNFIETGKVVKLETEYVKRIIGLPGETIDIKDGSVYIDGEILEENYLRDGVFTQKLENNISYPYKIGKDQYFVMGDNRTDSSDSRVWATVPEKNIIGKVLFSYFPLNTMRIID